VSLKSIAKAPNQKVTRRPKCFLLSSSDGLVQIFVTLLHPSEIPQKHISEKVGLSYLISKAFELMQEAAQLGFVEIVTVSTPNNWKAKQFQKRPLRELHEQPKELGYMMVG